MLLDTFNPTFAYYTSPQDLIIVAVVALVLFGGKKIPEMARGMGEGIREFKKSINGVSEAPAPTETPSVKPESE